MWRQAEFVALWSLSKSLESDMDFFGVCISYSNMLEIAHHQRKQSLSVALEIHALRFCHRKKSSVEADELKAVARLYMIIFHSRFVFVDLTLNKLTQAISNFI